MRDYEIVYVFKPDLSDEERGAKLTRIHALITEQEGEIQETDDWGKRVMAYEIKHNKEGHYGLTTFQLPAKAVRTLEERLNIDEDILRYQIVALKG